MSFAYLAYAFLALSLSGCFFGKKQNKEEAPVSMEQSEGESPSGENPEGGDLSDNSEQPAVPEERNA